MSRRQQQERKKAAEMEYLGFEGTHDYPSKYRSIITKKRLTQDQLHLLEMSFITNPKLEGDRKQELASKLGVPPKQVAIWYQNKRARCKIEAIELDYKAIQLQLQNVLAHNRMLQSEVSSLTNELNQAHHLLCLASKPSAAPASASASASASTSAPSFSVLGRSSFSSPETSMNTVSWGNADILPIMEELYACLPE